MRKQVHLFYSGKVQGVGFRYTLLDIARREKICGWVKNLDDGRVEVIAEASEDILSNFLQEINHQFSGYIKDLNTEWLPASGQLDDFGIRF